MIELIQKSDLQLMLLEKLVQNLYHLEIWDKVQVPLESSHRVVTIKSQNQKVLADLLNHQEKQILFLKIKKKHQVGLSLHQITLEDFLLKLKKLHENKNLKLVDEM